MKVITIEGKKYKIKGTLGSILKLIRKYKDIDKMRSWPEDRILLFAYDLTWKLLDCTLKPYLFFWRFKKFVDMDDIRNAQTAALSVFYGVDMEDKEPKN